MQDAPAPPRWERWQTTWRYQEACKQPRRGRPGPTGPAMPQSTSIQRGRPSRRPTPQVARRPSGSRAAPTRRQARHRAREGGRSRRRIAPEDQYGTGRAQRLTKAFQALEAFPALAESRDRLREAVGEGPRGDRRGRRGRRVRRRARRSRVLRVANEGARAARARRERRRRRRDSSPRDALQQLAERVRTFDFFEHTGVWDTTPDRFRLHALATSTRPTCSRPRSATRTATG